MRNRITKKYMRSVGALYGNQLDLDGIAKDIEKEKSKKNKVVERSCPTEQQEQFAVHAWLTKKGIVHHHSPNGGYRDYIEAAKFKRMGVSPGFPDFIFPYMRKGYGGLYIELKRMNGGKLSEHQLWWRDHLIKEGYAWYEAKGFDECVRIVCDYLGIT